MPKRRLYDPIVVEEDPKKGHTRAPPPPLVGNNRSPAEKTTGTTKSGTAAIRKNRKNAANTNKNRDSVGLSTSNDAGIGIASGPTMTPKNNRRSSEILLKLSEACRNHQRDTHPCCAPNDNDAVVATVNTSMRDYANAEESDIPSACQSAISKLDPLLPKLQRAISPTWAHYGTEASTTTTPTFGNTTTAVDSIAILEDVLLLCDFYISAMSGYYCPYLPRLFHHGHKVGSILNIVQYLLHHLLNPALVDTLSKAHQNLGQLDCEDGSTDVHHNAHDHESSESKLCDSVAIASFEKIADTIARFLVFLVDDGTSSVQKAVSVDIIDALEDLATVQVMHSQHPRATFPIRLTLFAETTFIAEKQILTNDSKEEVHDCTITLYHWNHLYVLQSAFVSILHSTTTKFAKVRHDELPEAVVRTSTSESPLHLKTKTPTVLPSGSIDLSLPADLILGNQIVPSLLAGLKAIILMNAQGMEGSISSAHSCMTMTNPSLLYKHRMSGAQTILTFLQNDYHGLGTPFASLSLTTYIEVSILILKGTHISCTPNNHQLCSPSQIPGGKQRLDEPAALSLLARLVHGVSLYPDISETVIYGQILPLLLDGLCNIATTKPHMSTELVLLYLKATHKISTFNFDLGLIACQHFTAHGMIRYMFSLLLATCASPGEPIDPRTGQIQFWIVELIVSFSMNDSGILSSSEMLENITDIENLISRSISCVKNWTGPSTAIAPSGKTQGANVEAVSQPGGSTFEELVSWCDKIDAIPLTYCDTVGYWLSKTLALVELLSQFKITASTEGVCAAKKTLSILMSFLRLLIASVHRNVSRFKIFLSAANVVSSLILKLCDSDGQRGVDIEFLKLDSIVESGIVIVFSKFPISSLQDGPYQSLRLLLDKSTKQAFKLLISSNVKQIHQSQCSFSCSGIPSRVIDTLFADRNRCDSHVDRYGTKCFCITKYEDICCRSSFAFVLSLPLTTKAAILIALTAPAITVSNIKDAIFRDLELRNASSNASENAPYAASALLHVLPLYSRTVTQNEGNGSSGSFHLETVAGIVKDILFPLLSKLQNYDASIMASFLFAIINFQSVVVGNIPIDTHDPAMVVKMLLVQHHGLRCSTQHGNINELMLQMLSSGFVETHFQRLDSFGRYMMWRAIANCCLNSTPALIARYFVEGFNLFGVSAFSWIAGVTFSDPDRRVKHLLRNAGAKFWIASTSGAGFFSCTSHERCNLDPMSDENRKAAGNVSPREAEASCTDHFFELLDKLIRESCDFSDTQLSMSIGNTSTGTSLDSNFMNVNRFSMQKHVAVFLGIICCGVDIGDGIGTRLFEESFTRLHRLWAAPNVEKALGFVFPAPLSVSGSNALAFGSILSCSECFDLSIVLSSIKPWISLPSALFLDLLNMHHTVARQQHFVKAERLLKLSFSSGKNSLGWKEDSCRVYSRLSDHLPQLIADIIVCEEQYGLHFVIGLHFYLKARRKYFSIRDRDNDEVVGNSNGCITSTLQLGGASMNDRERNKLLKDFCLGNIDVILPLVLLPARHGPLKLLSKITDLSLGEMIKNRDQGILKGIIWEMGRDRCDPEDSMMALKTAALARLDDGQVIEIVKTKQQGTTAAKDWVTERFMFLFVNMLQLNWRLRNREDKLRALRSLCLLLDFLHANQATQFLPQVIPTLSGAISDGCNGANDADLSFLSVKCLGKYVRLVANESMEPIVTGNLTAIVVAVIPVIENFDGATISTSKACDEAVSMLEYLFRSDVIERFPQAFSEIPFLPDSPSLEIVHQKLHENGITFDDLSVVAMPTPPPESQMDPSKRGANVSSLRKRLSLVSSLLENENSSVKGIALKHLVGLLRSNRKLFHALIHTEKRASPRDFLTVSTTEGSRHGIITDLIETLIRRCPIELDRHVRLQIAACLGEIGAIAESNLEDMALYRATGDEYSKMYRWRMKLPPWQTNPQQYELTLVTRHLVLALKAATTADEQVRIAHSIQQLLVLLDNSSRLGKDLSADHAKKQPMSQWLHDQLCRANVFEVVESFWFSEFSVKAENPNLIRQPPFFQNSTTYFSWISSFSRWMIFEANVCTYSPWKHVFFACRTAVKSLAGLEMAEFILPLLVCDRICFGSDQVFDQISHEFRVMLQVKNNKGNVRMPMNERRKAVGALFQVFDTLEYWAEQEIEESCRSARTTASNKRAPRRKANSESEGASNWCPKQAIMKIGQFLETAPILSQAKVASAVGMHARAVKLLESYARQTTVEVSFELRDAPETADDKWSVIQQRIEAALNPSLAKKFYANLNDFETVDALNLDPYISSPLLDWDGIKAKELEGDYEQALQDYERALQIADLNSSARDHMSNGLLGCLVELGRFESVLSTVEAKDLKDDENSRSFAVEAAWRLGKWDVLSELLNEDPKSSNSHLSCDQAYRNAIGNAIYAFHSNEGGESEPFLRDAKEAVMGSLSSVATESYDKGYSNLVQLHQIREIEDVIHFLNRKHQCETISMIDIANTGTNESWEWDGRLSLTSSSAVSSIMHTRLALARLGDDKVMEGNLLFQIGKQARKSGSNSVAESFLYKAEASFLKMAKEPRQATYSEYMMLDQVRTQYAKLKKESGSNSLALKILGQDSMETAFKEMMNIRYRKEDDAKLKQIAVKHEKIRMEKMLGHRNVAIGGDEDAFSDRFARRLLRLTEWTVDGGMHDRAIIDRFEIVIELSKGWEKGHFSFASYLSKLVGHIIEKESVKEPREDAARFNAFCRDKICRTYLLLAIAQYAECLQLDLRHVYQALPRLLSLWFDFVSTAAPVDDAHTYSHQKIESLEKAQVEANKFIASCYRDIPPAAFYTAIPQLVSHLFDGGEETTSVLKKILERVLYKFPEQAMWQLAWLTGSTSSTRSTVGKNIFMEAQYVLERTLNTNMAMLVKESVSLFKYFKDLARHRDEKASSNQIPLPPWKGSIGLECFVPPVQAALAIAPFNSTGKKSKEYFPRSVPRMSAFAPKVSMMTSKARPKKLVAFAVSGTSNRAFHTASGKRSRTGNYIGEFHFLVKQEAKGDLRKDARVQEWNLVVNRLLDASVNSTSSLASKSRRLRLRTFAVTCLSEDTGILEWVPDTDSLRNLVAKSYNPQTTPGCIRRRGGRLANFSDPPIRKNYEACQNYFFKEGNLEKASMSYKRLCLQEMPPLFSWWFVRNFNDDAHAWYEARLRFTLSAALWSAAGHVIGLGDRHSENILVETTTGRLLHVDFDCIFDKGLNLPRPEVVPFRLTPNMIDAFGPTGADGMFKRGMEYSLEILRGNQDTLLSVLEPFIKDPVIDWRRHRSQQINTSGSNDSFHEARRSISITRERLSGIYNLRNPNFRKYRIVASGGLCPRTKDTMMEVLPLSVEGQVQKLCLEATKAENLVQLYIGWMPWV
ncbi:phosphatidylinositol 3- and 4-kinase [Nitzschia inconspicua]|uniref:non-specific serine/threonine protein kinase n=1 Tax=Nitzschia inconspicua TaxID=303405 RepID=A0A9K3L6B6_9STRA|nr:phosphatidylinositol 3- and 4-kinase [Nitzschia inconspicua]